MNLFGNNATVQSIVSERRKDVAEVDALRRDITFSKLIPQDGITTATATASQQVNIIPVDTSSNAVTLTLQPVASMINRLLYIKDIGGNATTNNITVDANASETIDGSLTYVINISWESVKLWCNGEAWFII